MGANVSMTNHSRDIQSRFDDAVDRFLEEAGLHLEGEAKTALSMHPPRIDTGLLRNSITYAVAGQAPHIQAYSSDGRHKDGRPVGENEQTSGTYNGIAPTKDLPTVYLGSNLEYAPYVHEGTQRMAPNRFLKNAIEANKDQLKQRAIDIIGNI